MTHGPSVLSYLQQVSCFASCDLGCFPSVCLGARLLQDVAVSFLLCSAPAETTDTQQTTGKHHSFLEPVASFAGRWPNNGAWLLC